MPDKALPSFPTKLTRGGFLSGSPCWVTNGHLAVRRASIANEILFAPRVAELALGAENYKEIADEALDHIVPIGKRVRAYERQEAGYISASNPNGNAVLFRDPHVYSRTRVALVSEIAARTFGLATLYATEEPGGALFRGEVDPLSGELLSCDLIIAPIKVDGDVWNAVFLMPDQQQSKAGEPAVSLAENDPDVLAAKAAEGNTDTTAHDGEAGATEAADSPEAPEAPCEADEGAGDVATPTPEAAPDQPKECAGCHHLIDYHLDEDGKPCFCWQPDCDCEAFVAEPNCMKCGHAATVHGDTRKRGCMAEGCDCSGYVHPDPLGVADVNPQPEEQEAEL